eukprot:TRINITY_DN3498_c0_g1_i1.p1 TRINITY_DN3498_c0_g1~~TRINITY_DN3498_c0_g1_i1.p1  ORF type:complete len:197 (+),score=30.58 TRINITY_DN3498_c0_g1_i1:37-627(+)
MADDNLKLDEDDTYKGATQRSTKDIINEDSNDESLNKLKKDLGLTEIYSPADDPRKCVLTELRVLCPDRPEGDIVYSLESQESLQQMKKNPFVLKEGCDYKIQLSFRAQHEILLGLKFIQKVTRMGISLGTDKVMIGSYPPKKESHIVVQPRQGYESAPKGMAARATYTAHATFVDDDNQKHLEFEYKFEIKKDWK